MQNSANRAPTRPLPAVDTVRVRVVDTAHVQVTTHVRVIDTIAVVAPTPRGLFDYAQVTSTIVGIPIAIIAAVAAWRAAKASLRQGETVAAQAAQAREVYARSTAAAFVATKHRVQQIWRLAKLVDDAVEKGWQPGNHGKSKIFVEDIVSLMRDDAGTLASALGHDSAEWLGMEAVGEIAHVAATKSEWSGLDWLQATWGGFYPFFSKVKERLDEQLAEALTAAKSH